MYKSLIIAVIVFTGTLTGTVAAATGELSEIQGEGELLAVEEEVTGESQAAIEESGDSADSVNVYSEGGIQWGERYKGGICVVYNPETQQVEWKEMSKNGVGGVYDPTTKQVIWKEKYKHGVTGVLPGQADSLYCSSFASDYDKGKKRKRAVPAG